MGILQTAAPPGVAFYVDLKKEITNEILKLTRHSVVFYSNEIMS